MDMDDHRTAAGDTWVIMAWMGGILITGLGIISAFGGVPWGVPVLASVIWFPAITGLYLVFEKLDRTTRRDR